MLDQIDFWDYLLAAGLALGVAWLAAGLRGGESP